MNVILNSLLKTQNHNNPKCYADVTQCYMYHWVSYTGYKIHETNTIRRQTLAQNRVWICIGQIDTLFHNVAK